MYLFLECYKLTHVLPQPDSTSDLKLNLLEWLLGYLSIMKYEFR